MGKRPMMNLTKVVTEQRRLALLRTLSEVAYHLNEDVLLQALEEMSVASATKDLVRSDLTYLQDNGLIRVEKLPRTSSELWIGHLTAAGKDVANGRPHPGVAQRQPDC